MSLFKKLAIIGAVSTIMFLGLAVGSVSAHDPHDHHHDFHDTQCFNPMTGTIDLSKCPMVLTSHGWYVYPNQYTGFHPVFYGGNFFYNPYFYNYYPLYYNMYHSYYFQGAYPLYNQHPVYWYW